MLALTQGLMSVSGQATIEQTVWSATNRASDVILSNGDNDAESNSPTGGGIVLSVAGKTSGKFYVEVELVQRFNTNDAFGFGFQRGTGSLTNYIGQGAGQWGIWENDANASQMQSAAFNNSTSQSYQTAIFGNGVGRRLCMALDLDLGRVWFGDDLPTGTTLVWRRTSGSPNPSTNTDPTYTFTVGSDTYFIAANPRRGDSSVATNRNRIRLVNPASWRYAAPTGFIAWSP